MMQRRLFGFRFSELNSVEEVSAKLLAEKEQGVRFLITPNAAICTYFHQAKHRDLFLFYQDSAYVLPDGMPIVWLGRLKGIPLHRLAGSDLFPVLWAEIKARNLSAVFVLASQELADRLGQEYPKCRFVVPPMFSITDQERVAQIVHEVVQQQQAIEAEFIFLGITFPKQEFLGKEIAQVLKSTSNSRVLLLTLGASFEFYLKLKTRAPQWMQRTGLEWLYRFLKEPRRLWKRYTVDNFRFLWLASKEVFRK
ncbi:MAG: WecB/TagA/CpsF family glycosyltransferase [Bacteroidetes bacterium]|nr:WecB/TagA/CpsF family glycosyltransferase [Bacteroidota bacterium]